MSVETITSGELCARYRISRKTLLQWRKDPTFPKPLTWSRNGGGTWDAAEIRTWRARKSDRRYNRRRRAVTAYARRAGETGHLSHVAHAYAVDVGTLRSWVRKAGLPLPRDAA
jgi:predicted DNA-binding transcriptional regulator AlpA